MTHDTVKVKFEESHAGRFAGVTVSLDGGGYVSARFLDPANPDETNAAERVRVIEKAKSLFVTIGSS